MPGEFEYVLVTAASTLGDDAYGAAIREQIRATWLEELRIRPGQRQLEVTRVKVPILFSCTRP